MYQIKPYKLTLQFICSPWEALGGKWASIFFFFPIKTMNYWQLQRLIQRAVGRAYNCICFISNAISQYMISLSSTGVLR